MREVLKNRSLMTFVVLILAGVTMYFFFRVRRGNGVTIGAYDPSLLPFTLGIKKKDAYKPLAFPVYALSITNKTSRKIWVRILSPELRCNGIWKSFSGADAARWWPIGLSGGDLDILPGSYRTVFVRHPTQCDAAPLVSSDWRLGVSWVYSGPSRFELLQNRVASFFKRRSTPIRLDLDFIQYTNFTAEIPF